MNELAIIFKEIEVADCYFEHEMSLIPFQEGYFTESGDSEGFFTKLKKAVCDFIDKIVTSIKGVFEKFSTGKTVKKAEENLQKNPKLKDEKTKVKDWKKVHVLNKETQKKIQNAKSKEEVDQIMKEYKSKRNKILAATAAVTVTVGGLLLFLKKGKSKTVSAMEEQKQGMNYEKPVSTPKNETPKNNTAATKVEDTKKAKATADAEIRKTEVKDSADEVKEYMQQVTSGPLMIEQKHELDSKYSDKFNNNIDIAKENEIKENFEKELKKLSSKKTAIGGRELLLDLNDRVNILYKRGKISKSTKDTIIERLKREDMYANNAHVRTYESRDKAMKKKLGEELSVGIKYMKADPEQARRYAESIVETFKTGGLQYEKTMSMLKKLGYTMDAHDNLKKY